MIRTRLQKGNFKRKGIIISKGAKKPKKLKKKKIKTPLEPIFKKLK